MTLSPEDILIRAPKQVIGYHGCSTQVAEQLLAGAPFQLSKNDYDWLGSGVYFWEYAPFRARDWAQQYYESNWAVISAEITLGNSLNLLDTAYFADLNSIYRTTTQTLEAQGKLMPTNRQGANRLDRLVIDGLCGFYARRGGGFDTVRGCFPEGTPLFEGSQLLSHTHVQIAVRALACIDNLKLVHFE